MTILKSLLNRLAKVKPFDDNYGEVKELLKNALLVCDRWIECCQTLSGRLWKSSQAHKWEDDEFVPTSVVKYAKRLNEVLQIRSAKEQFSTLLKTVKDDQESDQSKINFKAFEGLEPLQYNPFTEPAWQDAVDSHNNSMNYIDQKTSQILKLNLRQAQSNPRQVFCTVILL
jgi:dynein heavy chain 2